MLSPAKAIVAGAIVFAIGGAFLVAQPFERQSGAAPDAATTPVSPVAFSAVMASGPCPVEETKEVVGQVRRYRGALCDSYWEPSVTMLEGTGTLSTNDDEYLDGSGVEVKTQAFSVIGDDGAWRERPRVVTDLGTFTLVMDGDGAFEGLTVIGQAVFRDLAENTFEYERGDGPIRTSEVWDVTGYIIDTGTPPAGNNASTR